LCQTLCDPIDKRDVGQSLGWEDPLE